MDEMLRAVDEVLEEIGAGDRPRLLVLNKADALDDERREELRFAHPDGILVSALDRRRDRGARRAHRATSSARRCARSTCCCPSPRAPGWPSCTSCAGDLERIDTADGVRIRGRVPVTVAERYARFDVANGDGA